MPLCRLCVDLQALIRIQRLKSLGQMPLHSMSEPGAVATGLLVHCLNIRNIATDGPNIDDTYDHSQLRPVEFRL